MQKYCPRCDKNKSLTAFHANRATASGRTDYCKECVSKYNAVKRKANKQRYAKAAGEQKRCTKCEKSKPVEEFYNNRTATDGCSKYCKLCQKAYMAMRYRDNPEVRARAREYNIDWLAKNKDWDLLRKVLSKEEARLALPLYIEKKAQTAGHCEICNAPCKQQIDHNHATGKFRGLLCSNCNRAIGMLKDDPVRMRKAAEYVETRP